MRQKAVRNVSAPALALESAVLGFRGDGDGDGGACADGDRGGNGTLKRPNSIPRGKRACFCPGGTNDNSPML